MTAHRPHPISGEWAGSRYADPSDAILYDDCPRCEEHAATPLNIDPERLGVLYERMIEVERAENAYIHYRTGAEADVCRWLYRLALFVERTTPWLDPWRWPWRLRPALLPAAHMSVDVPLVDLPTRPDEKDLRDE